MKFEITLSPQARLDYTPMSVALDGSVVIVNGERYDLSPLDVGMMIDAEDFAPDVFSGSIEHREDGYHLTLKLHTPLCAPERMAFPKPITATESGPVDLPKPDLPTEKEGPEDGPVKD